MGGSVAYVRNPADILNYGGIKCYPVYWVRTRGRVVAGSKYYLNKNKNKNNVAVSKYYLNKNNKNKHNNKTTRIRKGTAATKHENLIKLSRYIF
jgi:hypothetical protein